jgi:hypothetical protein
VKLKLTYVESDFRGTQRVIGEELLDGESDKPMTKGRAKKLVHRFHPDFRAFMIDASDFPAEWVVHTERKSPNLWVNVYASRVSSN